MKHTIMCKCGKLAIKCKEASKALNLIVNNAKEEVFDDIRNKFNSKHQCSSCDYGIMEFELERLEKKHLNSLSPDNENKS